MARRIDKLQINALNASNSQILVARGGELAYDDPANVFVGSSGDANFANVALVSNFANTAGIANVSLEANLANVALEANIANLVLTLSNFTTDDLNEGSGNLYYTDARVLAAVDPKLTTANVTELDNLYYTNSRVTAHIESTTFSNVTAVSVAANSFTSTGFGVPTIESATNIVLSANGTNGGAVVIQDSALRLRSYDDGAIANLTASAGDAVFNSSINKAQIYDGTNWANVGAGIIDGDQEYSGNLLPTQSNVFSLGSPEYRWKDLYLSGNTIFLGDVQLSSANNKLVVNSIEANIIVTSNPTLYTSGRGITISRAGIIATTADDSEVYDIGINESVGYTVTDALLTAFNHPNASVFSTLLYGFTITNASSATVYLNAEYRTNDGNVYSMANALPIFGSNTIEFVGNKPEVIMPGTSILLRATANTSLYSTFVYKTQDETSFTRFVTNVATSGQFVDIFSTESTALIENIKVHNITNSVMPVTAIWADSSNNIKSYLVANSAIAANNFKELLNGPKLMGLGDKIRLAHFSTSPPVPNSCTAFVSARYGEVYNIVQSSNTLAEGQSVTYSISTLNVPSNSTRYYRTLSISGNVNSSDFVEGNTGSFLIIDGAANITLTTNADVSSFFEGDEVFKFVIARDSVVGPALRTSDETTLIRDSSNIINFSSASTPASIFETEEAIITINMINADGSPGGTVYYTITGNADIYSNTSGAIEINNNTANLSIIAEASVPDDEERQFTVQIRKDSISGTIIGTTSNIIVKPVTDSDIGLVATGGNITEINV